MNNRYKISCLINKIKFKDSSLKIFEIFENNKNKNINLNLDELTNLTNDNNISNQIINIYNNHLLFIINKFIFLKNKFIFYVYFHNYLGNDY